MISSTFYINILYRNQNVGTKGTDQMETSTSPEIGLEKTENYKLVPLENCPSLFNCFTKEKQSLQKESATLYFEFRHCNLLHKFYNNCQIVRSRSLTHCMNYKFMYLSAY